MASQSPPERPGRSRRLAFAALVAACVLVAGGVVLAAASRDDSAGQDSTLPKPATASPDASGELPPAGIVFQNVKRDSAYAHMAITNASASEPPRITRLVCERAYFSAARGICLLSKQGLTSAQFDV